jgi:hypothetical protein
MLIELGVLNGLLATPSAQVAAGLVCGVATELGFRSADHTRQTISNMLKQAAERGQLPINHDIERAVAKAHLRACHFLLLSAPQDQMGDTSTQGREALASWLRSNYEARDHVLDYLTRRVDRLDHKRPANSARELLAQEVLTELGQVCRELSKLGVDQLAGVAAAGGGVSANEAALAHVLALGGWKAGSQAPELLGDIFRDPNAGWSAAFSLCFAEELKEDDRLNRIVLHLKLAELAAQQVELAGRQAGRDKALAKKLDALTALAAEQAPLASVQAELSAFAVTLRADLSAARGPLERLLAEATRDTNDRLDAIDARVRQIQNAASWMDNFLVRGHNQTNTPESERLRPFHYSERVDPFVGRQSVMRQLNDTLLDRATDADGFRWAVVSGEAGTGKSRLGQELVEIAALRFPISGFVTAEAIEDPEFARKVELHGPTFLVVDYSCAFRGSLPEFMKSWLRRMETVAYPLRILILMRQRGDPLIIKELTRRGLHQGADIGRHRVRGDFVLERLDREDDLLNLMRSRMAWTADRLGLPLRKIDNTALLRELDRIDDQRRPLFAAFVADSLQRDSADRGTPDEVRGEAARYGLLGDYLRDQRSGLWRDVARAESSGDDARAQKAQRRHETIALLSTLVRGLTPAALERLVEEDDRAADLLISDIGEGGFSSELLYHIVGSSADTDKTFATLQPDLLGEVFVLDALTPPSSAVVGDERGFHNRRRAWLLQTAWKIAPEATASFIRLAAQDFPTRVARLDWLGPAAATPEERRLRARHLRDVAADYFAGLTPVLITEDEVDMIVSFIAQFDDDLVVAAETDPVVAEHYGVVFREVAMILATVAGVPLERGARLEPTAPLRRHQGLSNEASGFDDPRLGARAPHPHVLKAIEVRAALAAVALSAPALKGLRRFSAFRDLDAFIDVARYLALAQTKAPPADVLIDVAALNALIDAVLQGDQVDLNALTLAAQAAATANYMCGGNLSDRLDAIIDHAIGLIGEGKQPSPLQAARLQRVCRERVVAVLTHEFVEHGRGHEATLIERILHYAACSDLIFDRQSWEEDGHLAASLCIRLEIVSELAHLSHLYKALAQNDAQSSEPPEPAWDREALMRFKVEASRRWPAWKARFDAEQSHLSLSPDVLNHLLTLMETLEAEDLGLWPTVIRVLTWHTVRYWDLPMPDPTVRLLRLAAQALASPSLSQPQLLEVMAFVGQGGPLQQRLAVDFARAIDQLAASLPAERFDVIRTYWLAEIGRPEGAFEAAAKILPALWLRAATDDVATALAEMHDVWSDADNREGFWRRFAVVKASSRLTQTVKGYATFSEDKLDQCIRRPHPNGILPRHISSFDFALVGALFATEIHRLFQAGLEPRTWRKHERRELEGGAEKLLGFCLAKIAALGQMALRDGLNDAFRAWIWFEAAAGDPLAKASIGWLATGMVFTEIGDDIQLYVYEGLIVEPGTETWPLPPLCDGEWRSCDLRSAFGTAVTVDESARPSFLVPGLALAPRARTLGFYPDGALIELGLVFRERVITSMIILKVGSKLWRLDGEAAPFHEANKATAPDLSTPEAALEFVKVFASAIHGDASAFTVVEDPAFRAAVFTKGLALPEAVMARLDGGTVSPLSDGGWRVDAAVFFGARLDKAVFMVDKGGLVSMIDEENLLDDIKLPRDIYLAGWRIGPD